MYIFLWDYMRENAQPRLSAQLKTAPGLRTVKRCKTTHDTQNLHNRDYIYTT